MARIDKIDIPKIMARSMQEVADKMELVTAFLEGEMTARANGQYGQALKAFDSGYYANSFSHKVIKGDKVVTGLVGNSAEYAPYIEFGTGEFAESGDGRKGGWVYKNAKTGKFRFTLGMKSRPVMRTGMLENKDKIIKFFKS